MCSKRKFWIAAPVILLILLLAGGGWYGSAKIAHLKNGMADTILSAPESSALVAYTFDENGEMVDDGNALFYHADQPLVLGSVVKLAVLAAYAGAVADGSLDPAQSVPISEVERYFLPGTDGGAHQAGLKSLDVETDDLGFAVDPSAALTLDDLARIMIHYSGNAETDYLIMRLGADAVASALDEAGLEHHSPIGLFLGYSLAILDHGNPSFSSENLQALLAANPSDAAVSMERLVDLYLNDGQWRAAQIEFVTHTENFNVTGVDFWAYQVMAAGLFPRGTAREYAQMMAKIASGTFISPEVSRIMQQKLENIPADWPLRLLFYDREGSKDGVTAGVLALASYAIPKRGPLRGQRRVVVLIVNQMPPETWMEQVNLNGHYFLPIDLVQGNGLFSKFR